MCIECFYVDDGGLRLGLVKERMDVLDLRELEFCHHGLCFGTFFSEWDQAEAVMVGFGLEVPPACSSFFL